MSKEIESIRIVHVAPTPFGVDGLFGGGERYSIELARALARDTDCELVTFGKPARVEREPSGLRVRILPPLAYGHRHPAHPIAPTLPLALRGADLVHAHHMRSAPSRVAAVTARLARKRIVVTDHGLGGGGWGGLLPQLFDRFLTVSGYSAQILGVPSERTRVIYGGADVARFHPGRGDRRQGVLFVGRFTPHKGLDRLIEALPGGAELTCVGSFGHDPRPPESGYGDLLRRLAAERAVRFAGTVPDVELPAVYRRAQVFVLPSVHRTVYGKDVAISELLGLSVLEAMASGTPVVCSRLGGVPEIVRDGETGFLVEPGNVEQLRDRLATLLADRTLAGRMGQSARAWVMERFTWQVCAARCLEAYVELLGR